MLLHIVDIETTGLNRMTDDIVEVGYIRANHNLDIVGYGTLYFYKPEFNIESSAQSIHGLKRSFLQQYEGDFGKNLAALYTLIRGAAIVGKNSGRFDVPFIREFISKHEPALYDSAVPRISVDMQDEYALRFRAWYTSTYGKSTTRKGTLQEYMPLIGYSPERIQEEFTQAFPESSERSNAHNALYDAFMTYLLLKNREV